MNGTKEVSSRVRQTTIVDSLVADELSQAAIIIAVDSTETGNQYELGNGFIMAAHYAVLFAVQPFLELTHQENHQPGY